MKVLSILLLCTFTVIQSKEYFYNAATGSGNDCTQASPCKELPSPFLFSEASNIIHLVGDFTETKEVVLMDDPNNNVGPVTELIIQTLTGTPTPAKIHSTSADWLITLRGAKVSIIDVEFDGVPLRARETAELHLNNTKIYNVANEKHYAAEAKVLSVSTNCEFRGNAGGALKGDAVSVFNSNFYNNKATLGGAVYVNTVSGNHKLELKDVIFQGNEADFGGAVYSLATHNEIARVQFKNNNATMEGGALYVTATNQFSMDSSNFTGNSVGRMINGTYTLEGRGGAISVQFGNNKPTVEVTNVYATANAAHIGGGLFIDTFMGSWTNSLFLDNHQEDDERLDIAYESASVCFAKSCNLCETGLCLNDGNVISCVSAKEKYSTCNEPQTCTILPAAGDKPIRAACLCNDGSSDPQCGAVNTSAQPYTYAPPVIPTRHNPHSGIPTPVVVLICLLFVGIIGLGVWFFARKFRQSGEKYTQL